MIRLSALLRRLADALDPSPAPAVGAPAAADVAPPPPDLTAERMIVSMACASRDRRPLTDHDARDRAIGAAVLALATAHPIPRDELVAEETL